MTRVWPADTSTGGISILVADLGSAGALAGPEGTESLQSTEMGNWRREGLASRGDMDKRMELRICRVQKKSLR